MSCESVRRQISSLLDGKLPAGEREGTLAHIETCRKCGAYAESLAHLRVELRRLSDVAVPSELGARLRVMASHERERWLTRVSMSARAAYWASRARLTFDNLMRPLALPLAGGLASALLLFALLVPTLGFRPSVLNDIPTGFYTAATLVEVAPLGIHNDETVVALYVDAKGQAMDYSVQQGKVSPEMQADLTKMMFFSRFTPATWFGQPTNGKVLVSFRRINYVVRG